MEGSIRGPLDPGVDLMKPPTPPWVVGPDVGTDLLSPSVHAAQDIDAKWQSLAGSPGEPLHPGPVGLIEVPGGFRRHYARGSIYRRNDGQPFFVDLPTDRRYDQLGGPGQYLGFPVSDSTPDPQEPASGVTTFENGAIYFWPDIGAIEMQEIALRYAGWHCFGETDDGFSASDEMYFIFGVVPALTEHRAAKPTRIYHDTDAGESRSEPTPMELYRGAAYGAAVSITLVEHDDGDPKKYHASVERAVERTADRVVEGLAHVPVLGTFLAVLAEVVLVIALPAITDGVNELLGRRTTSSGPSSWVSLPRTCCASRVWASRISTGSRRTSNRP